MEVGIRPHAIESHLRELYGKLDTNRGTPFPPLFGAGIESPLGFKCSFGSTN